MTNFTLERTDSIKVWKLVIIEETTTYRVAVLGEELQDLIDLLKECGFQ